MNEETMLATTADESTIRPDDWADMLDRATANLDLPIHPAWIISDLHAYCRNWFNRSIPNASKRMRDKLEEVLATTKYEDTQAAVFKLLTDYHGTADWRREQRLIREAQEHTHHQFQSGAKGTDENGKRVWTGQAVYEWPPLIQTPEGSTGLHHQPARYLFDHPVVGRIDLGKDTFQRKPTDEELADPRALASIPRWKRVLHTSPDKAVQAMQSRSRMGRFGGAFNRQISAIFRKCLSWEVITHSRITGEKLPAPWSRVTLDSPYHRNHKGEPITFAVKGDASEIPDLIIPASLTFWAKEWVVYLFPQINPVHLQRPISDPENFGEYLSVSGVTHQIISEPSQPREDDENSWDPRSEEPVHHLEDISYLDESDLKWDLLNGYSSIHQVDDELKFAIRSHIREIWQRIKQVRFWLSQPQHLEPPYGKRTIRLFGLHDKLMEDLATARNAYKVYLEETIPLAWFIPRHVRDKEEAPSGYSLKPSRIDGKWHNAAPSEANRPQLGPEAHQLPENKAILRKPKVRNFRSDRTFRKALKPKTMTYSVIEKGKPSITGTGRRTFIEKERPTWTLQDASPRLRFVLAHLKNHGRLPALR